MVAWPTATAAVKTRSTSVMPTLCTAAPSVPVRAAAKVGSAEDGELDEYRVGQRIPTAPSFQTCFTSGLPGEGERPASTVE